MRSLASVLLVFLFLTPSSCFAGAGETFLDSEYADTEHWPEESVWSNLPTVDDILSVVTALEKRHASNRNRVTLVTLDSSPKKTWVGFRGTVHLLRPNGSWELIPNYRFSSEALASALAHEDRSRLEVSSVELSGNDSEYLHRIFNLRSPNTNASALARLDLEELRNNRGQHLVVTRSTRELFTFPNLVAFIALDACLIILLNDFIHSLPF